MHVHAQNTLYSNNCSTQVAMYHRCVNIGKEKEVWERWSKDGRYKEGEEGSLE